MQDWMSKEIKEEGDRTHNAEKTEEKKTMSREVQSKHE